MDIPRETPLVSVVIPTYDRTDVLEECLLSIDSQSYDHIQIIISDDSTNDDVKKMVTKIKMSREVEYFRNPVRLGLPANRNRGIAHASGSLIFSLDDDTTLEESCIQRLVCAYSRLRSEGKRVGAIGPAVITDHSRKSKSGITDFAARRFMKPRKGPCYRSGITGLVFMDFSPVEDKCLEVDELHSSSIYPAEVLNEVGLYEERLFQGNFICEETDLHARIRKAGYGLFFEPRAILNHKPLQTGGCKMDALRYTYYYLRNQGIYTIRHNGFRAVFQVPAMCMFIMLSGLVGLICYGSSAIHR